MTGVSESTDAGMASVEAARAGTADTTDAAAPTPGRRRPLYVWMLQLHHVHPNAWQRAALGEGSVALAAILVLADLASAWVLVVLPLTVALVVKGHDLLGGLLAPVGDVTGVGGPEDAGSAGDPAAADAEVEADAEGVRVIR